MGSSLSGKKSGDTLTKEGAPAGNEIGEAVRPVNYLLIGTGGSSLSQSLPFVLPALSAAELPSPPTGPGKAAFWSLVALRPRRSLEQGLRGRSKTLGDDLPPAKGLELSFLAMTCFPLLIWSIGEIVKSGLLEEGEKNSSTGNSIISCS